MCPDDWVWYKRDLSDGRLPRVPCGALAALLTHLCDLLSLCYAVHVRTLLYALDVALLQGIPKHEQDRRFPPACCLRSRVPGQRIHVRNVQEAPAVRRQR